MMRELLEKLWQASDCYCHLIHDNGCAIIELYDEDGNVYETPRLVLNKMASSSYRHGGKTLFDAMYDQDPCMCEWMVMIAFAHTKAKEII